MAIAPETGRADVNTTAARWTELNWNSGVLYINLKGLLAVLPNMIQFANSKDWDFIVMDQTLINEFFSRKYGRTLDVLSDSYNWKGYWGCNPDIVLVHWHGPKPELCLNCYIAHREESMTDPDIAACSCPHAYNVLWQQAMNIDNGKLYVHIAQDQKRYVELARM